MKENLNNLKLVNKKGGCMLRKVLSVLVICCFMFSNVCFAMPSAMGIKATVDNMAIETFLSSGDVSALKSADMKAMATVLTALTMDTYSEADAQAILNMWVENAGESTKERIASLVTYSKDNLSKKVDEKTISDGLTQNSEGKVSIDRKPTDFSSRIQDKTQEAALKAQMAENIKKATPTTESKAEIAAALEASLIADGANAAAVASVIAVLNNVEVSDVEPVISEDDGMNNRIHSAAVVNHIYIDKNLTGDARTDMILHELLHIKNGFSEADTMKEQMALRKVANKVDRQRGDNQMARTRAAMEQSAQKVIDAREAKSPSSKMSVEPEFVKADPKDPATQAKALEIVKKVFPNDIDKANKLAPEVLAMRMQELGLQKIKEFVDGIADARIKFMLTVSGLTSETDQAELLVKQAAGLKDGEVLALDFDMMFTSSNGRIVPRAGAVAAFDALSKSSVKAGAIQVISAGNFAQEAKKTLAFLYPDLGEKVNVNVGNESTLAVVNVNPALLRVFYSSTTSIQGDIAEVLYILAPKLDKVNGLQVIIAALAPNLKSLTASEQAILSDLGGGKFKLENVAIDDAAYAVMQADYKTVIDLLIQA
ncbi:MAG: hypothetical protein KJ915_00835 [Candidatus Omnitrophica bacterium]|nr:hypothetical protein [Candidatus Omnitrophota bacterium]